MNNFIEDFEKQIISYLPSDEGLEKDLISSMEYSLSAGGKRIRPLLTAYFCELCGGSVEMAMPFACAIEMVHTYSLIHDDLPCMDDDDIRRGRASNHKVYGEDIALLAGDALQSLAFEIMSSDQTAELVGIQACLKGINVLSSRIGALGMVGGQTIDLKNENTNAKIEVLKEMDSKKTGALISAACELGCIAAGAPQNLVDIAANYGKAIGLAFQIMDDILDVTSSTEDLGKTVGSDGVNNKSTYVSLLGIDECRNIVNSLTAQAIDYLSLFSGDTSKLMNLTIDLSERNK